MQWCTQGSSKGGGGLEDIHSNDKYYVFKYNKKTLNQ